MPSNSRKHRNASAPERVRSARADTFARLRDDSGLPNGGVGASVGDQMYFRTLLIAILAVCAALFAGVAAAGADDPAPGAPPSPTRRCASRSTAPSTSLPPARPPASRWPAPRATRRPPRRPLSRDPAATPAEQPAPAPAAEQPAPAPVRRRSPRRPIRRPRRPAARRSSRRRSRRATASRTLKLRSRFAPKTGSHEKADADAKSKDADKDKSDADNGGVAGPAVDDYPLVLAPPLPARSIPNILLDRFQIPPFLLPLYQAAGVQYGVRWEILAAINSIETDYGRNLSVSTAGAVGWMQFMPSTWEMYGVDANGDGRKDPYNPVDAIFAAARYLKAAGAGDSLRRAIFAYNHADWYVNDVIGRASAISELPDEVVASLSGLTLGRFPIAGRAGYAGRVEHQGRSRLGPQRLASRSRATATAAACASTRRPEPPVVAVQDGVVVGIGETERLGKFVRLRDAYGNRYVYGHLGTIAADASRAARAPRQRASAIRHELGLDRKDKKPKHGRDRRARRGSEREAGDSTANYETAASAPAVAALLDRPRATLAGVVEQSGQLPAGVSSYDAWFAQPYTLDPADVKLEPLRKGSRVIGGTILGHVGRASLRREGDGQRRRPQRRALRSPTPRASTRAPHLLVRGPPRRQPRRRASTRSRSSTAGACSSATKIYGAAARSSTADGEPTKLTRRPGAADEQGAAPAARARQPGHHDLRAAGARTSAPASSTAACSRRSSTSSPRT